LPRCRLLARFLHHPHRGFRHHAAALASERFEAGHFPIAGGVLPETSVRVVEKPSE
jgi:hypothetical protein